MAEPGHDLPIVRFGAFEVDFRAAEVRKAGLKIKVQEQPFQILEMLLDHPGEVVTREELRKKLWPADTFVDFEHGLNAAVNKLREALGDSADNPRFVETLPRRGYRFIAPVDTVAPVYDRRIEDAARRAALQRRLAAAGAVMVAVVAALLTFNVVGLRDRVLRAVGAIQESPLQIRSIAVLPLENLSRDPEQEYFADGMTDELITNLGKISALRVISRQSTMRYKGSKKPLPEIAKELNVDAVVEGTVQRSGDRVRITANLLHAPTDRHLWADSYERDLRDVLVLQGEVAQAITAQIKIALTSQEQSHLASTRPVNPEAYQAYLKGRYFWNKRGEESVKKSLGYFEEAIRKDPGFALAYAGIGDSYRILGAYEYLPPKEAYTKAKNATQKALEIDPTNAEAHASLGMIRLECDWNFLAAENEYKQAMELSPNYATARMWYATLLLSIGRRDEALKEVERARQLDPLSLIANTNVGVCLAYAGRYEEAIREYQKTIEMDPDFVIAHFYLADAYVQNHRFPEAIAESQKAVSLSREAPIFMADLARVYAAAGDSAAAHKVLKQVCGQPYVPKYTVALAHAALGERDQAFSWLEKAVEERSPQLVWLKVDPNVDPMRSDPRYQDLLRRMNFPP